MRVFLQVVESGSFAAASRVMAVSKPMVTRAVARLESQLRARLLQRSTRSVLPTAIGIEYARRCGEILAAIDEADAFAGQEHVNPRGLLRVAIPSSLALTLLAPVLAEYARRHPEVKLDVSLVDRQIDMIEEGFDVAIVVDSMLNSDDVVARRASLSHFVACCTPAYLGSLQAPSTFAELKGHRIFCLRRFAGELPKLESRRVNITGNSAMLRLLALEDAGIVIVPTFLVTDDLSAGRLVKVLQNETLPAVDVWVAYPTRKYVSAKVERFVEAAFTQLVHAG